NGSLEICEDDTNTYDLFNSLGGTPDSGGIWSPALNSGTGLFDPALDAPGTYTYTVVNQQCGFFDSAEVIVTITELPDITGLELSTNNICEGENLMVNILNANSLEDGNYFIIYNITGADNFTDSVLVTINNGEGNFLILASAFTIYGNYELNITDFIPENGICSADTSFLNPIVFEVYESITPILVDQGDVFCISVNPTIEDLSNNITNNDTVIWYDSIENGNIIPPNTLLVDGETYYASIMSSNNCPSIIRLAVTVNLKACIDDLLIPDGFSPNGDHINDTFHINNLNELYPNFYLEIYNRYGNKLYKGDINTPDWDGKSNTGSSLGNSVVPVGVYYFILKFNDGNRQPIQGRVYLNM
ncbi:gliding motility-associated C-terminal domain-containing protein, partial [Xanthomarina spongicola]